jgi:8-oxo-dGTP diphosphatase
MQVAQNIKIAVDAIVFGYQNNTIYVLLIQQKFGELQHKWVLPGGFVHDGESLQSAVQRELFEEAGISVNYLEQLYTFGDEIERDPRGRVISVAYFALVNSQKLKLAADTDAEDAQWFPIQEVPKLGFDHNMIIEVAKNRLKNKLQYQPIGFDLLGSEFPFSDLENLYTTILGKEIDRRNFRKKMLGFGILEEIDKISKKGSGRPAKLFRFNQLIYNELAQKGFHFDIDFA